MKKTIIGNRVSRLVDLSPTTAELSNSVTVNNQDLLITSPWPPLCDYNF
jgi:hypothetical protein